MPAGNGPQFAPQTRIIRRAPSAPLPQIVNDARTTHIPRQPPPSSYVAPSQRPGPASTLPGKPSSATAVAATPRPAAEGVLAQLARLRIVPVIIIDDLAAARPLADALAGGGLGCVEITLRTPAAVAAITRSRPTILAKRQSLSATSSGWST